MERRFMDDFEVWARECVLIRHKLTGEMVPFVLNGAQRRVLAALEAQRRAGKPIRVIVLKARQWGSSTLIAHYLAWIQLFHTENWNSVMCAQLLNTAATLRHFVSSLVRNYPEEHRPEGLRLCRFENSGSVLELKPTGARVAICSAESVDAMRGMDVSMAHLSEVAFWPEGKRIKSTDVVRSIVGSVPRVANSVIVMESTANGVGNFFHRQWCMAVAGEGDMTPVFVPWFEIEQYAEPLTAPWETVKARLSKRELEVMEAFGLSREQMNWYNHKLREMGNDYELMAAEYPSTASEAFMTAEDAVFETGEVESLRQGVKEPEAKLDYSAEQREFSPNASGALAVWEEPREGHRYVASVDIGSVWRGGDWSVIGVFDVTERGEMSLVAQWRGHERHDRLADISMALGRRYDTALLAVESNSDEGRSLSVMERIAASGYRNIYQRQVLDSATNRQESRYGFHTNKATKQAAIGALSAMMRDGRYTERCEGALEELAAYIRKPNGAMGAPEGMHDDMVMARAIAAYVATYSPPRKVVPFPTYL